MASQANRQTSRACMYHCGKCKKSVETVKGEIPPICPACGKTMEPLTGELEVPGNRRKQEQE